MKPLKIGIVEDELLTAKSISITLKKIGYEPIKAVRTYDAAIKMIQSESPDLLLLDIILDGEKDGIDLGLTINKEFDLPFIFLTANSDEATINRAKAAKPLAYLVKPFNQHEIFSTIEIAFNNFNEQKRTSKALPEKPKMGAKDYFFIKQDGVFHKVRLADILYVMSEHIYLNIYTIGKTYLLRTKLEDFLTEYAGDDFVRVHRSYAVNLQHLNTVHDNFLKVSNLEIPLGKGYKQDLILSINALK